MEHRAVVVVGAGPTGLMLAGELALAGTDVTVVERRVDQQVDGSRAGGLHARTIEVLDQRGIADRFLEAGQPAQVQAFGGVPLDISDFPVRHNHGLALWQRDFEPLLAGWVDELGVPLLRGREVAALAQDPDGVDLDLSDGARLRAAYVVGCDGGRSRVRRAAGIEFVGSDPTTSWLLAEADFDEEPELGFRHDATGTHAIGRRGSDEAVGVVLTDPELVTDGTPDVDDLRRGLRAVYGTDFGPRAVHWITRFTDATRQASTYRRGRVLVAGDAAHVHPPQGGQGLNTGVQDAVNLGWKLAQVVAGASPETLLDTYHDERHPVAARVLRTTLAQVAVARPGERHEALREVLGELLALDEPRRRLAGELSGLDIRYDLGEGHPLLGHRVPDLDLDTDDGPTRVHALLHDARGVLLDLRAGDHDALPRHERVRTVRARALGPWDLPVVGVVPAPPVVLVRPDGHVAWAGDPADTAGPGLSDALTTWFGA